MFTLQIKGGKQTERQILNSATRTQCCKIKHIFYSEILNSYQKFKTVIFYLINNGYPVIEMVNKLLFNIFYMDSEILNKKNLNSAPTCVCIFRKQECIVLKELLKTLPLNSQLTLDKVMKFMKTCCFYTS